MATPRLMGVWDVVAQSETVLTLVVLVPTPHGRDDDEAAGRRRPELVHEAVL